MGNQEIPFSRLYYGNRELQYLRELLDSKTMGVRSRFGKRCAELLKGLYGAEEVIITQSCTTALEMAALLCDLQPGDEVVLPSFTFSSTANAFALRGARLAFVDITEDTLNIDPGCIEAALNDRTTVIAPVHYAGVSCDMQAISAMAEQHGLLVVEDAAQAIGASYRGDPVGSRGDMATLSFHNTKNIVSGEGGALIINHPDLVERAWMVAEKGTNRKQFYEGMVDKYTWTTLGVSALPSELTCAFLLAQLENLDAINRQRLDIWQRYQQSLAVLESEGLARLPRIPDDCLHNGHIFYLLLNTAEERSRLISFLRDRGITAPFHYIPLHSSPAGRELGYPASSMQVTDALSARLMRLPAWAGMDGQVERVVEAIMEFFGRP